MTLDDFPATVPGFTPGTCPKGNVWLASVPELWRELQRCALKAPGLDCWRMLPKGAQVALRFVPEETLLVFQIQRSHVSERNAVPSFGREVQGLLREFNVGRQVRAQRIDDRRHEPERRLRWLALLGPKTEVVNA